MYNNLDHYFARVEALRLASQLEGSTNFKIAKAEEFYQFLAKGIYPQTNYPGAYITYTATNVTSTNG